MDNDDTNLERSCSLCTENDDSQMVACDVCSEWFHYKCVGVTDSISEKEWMCRKCKKAEAKQKRLKGKTPKNLDNTVIGRPTANSTALTVNERDKQEGTKPLVNKEVISSGDSQPHVQSQLKNQPNAPPPIATTSNQTFINNTAPPSNPSLRGDKDLDMGATDRTKPDSIRSSTSSARQTALLMKLIEEEKLLAEQRLKENTDTALRLADAKIEERKLEIALEESRLRSKLSEEILKKQQVEKERLDKQYISKKIEAIAETVSSRGSLSSSSGSSLRTQKWIKQNRANKEQPQPVDNFEKEFDLGLQTEPWDCATKGDETHRHDQPQNSSLRPGNQPSAVNFKGLPTARGGPGCSVSPQDDGLHNFTYLPKGKVANKQAKVSHSSLNPIAWLSARNQTEFSIAHERDGNPRNSDIVKLTKDQIAARQVTPKQLPKFDGNPRDWAHFYSTYISTTRLCGYTNCENQSRLLECLVGKAREKAYAGLMIPETVPKAVNTLRMCYGRPEIIIESLIEEIRKVPTIKHDCHEDIVDYSLKVQYLCAIMEASQLQDHLNNPILKQEILNKLPPTIRLSWSFYQRSVPNSNLSTLSEWLFDIAEAVGDISISQPLDRRGADCKVVRGKNPRALFTTSTDSVAPCNTFPNSTNGIQSGGKNVANTTTTRQLQNINEEKRCAICKASHAFHACPEFLKMTKRERWSAVFKHHVCSGCLGYHYFKGCKVKVTCEIDGCKKLHHRLLHNQKRLQENQGNNGDEIEEQTSSAVARTPTALTAHVSLKSNVAFRIVPVTIHGPRKSLNLFAFLDDGSSVTLLDDEIADQLQLDGPVDALCLRWTGNTTKNEPNSRRVSLKISGVHEKADVYTIKDVRTVPNLSLPIQELQLENIKEKYQHLRDLPITEYDSVAPRILIGLQHVALTVPLEVREGNWGDPIAVNTRLGWTMFGMCESSSNDHFVQVHSCNCSRDVDLHEQVQGFFSLENFGVKIPQLPLESDDERRARMMLEEHTKRINKRFETSLLWRCEEINFPNSLPMAIKRLSCLEKKMSKEPGLKDILNEHIKHYVSKGYARKLSPEEIRRATPRTWYLPIFVVRNPNKPEKIRLVWDAAATVDGVSLNTMLLPGPDLLTSLPNVLTRFREKKFAICGDIREMFHQIVVRQCDRESQRFLWRSESGNQLEFYEMCVMVFGATCSPSAAQFVKNLNASEFAHKYPKAHDAIVTNHYVDDWLQSFHTENEAIEVATQVKEVHEMGGFEIRNWLSNSKRILREMNASNDSNDKSFDESNSLMKTKVLGMFWSMAADKIHFVLNADRFDDGILGGRRPTKRQVLRTLMMIFDPLGLIAHVLVHAKLLLQQIWRSNIEWDDLINVELFSRWTQWLQLIKQINEIQIPRCFSAKISNNSPPIIELHIFVDASEGAYAAVAFMRVEDENGVDVSLISAKTKVGPKRPLTIPRMELQAAVLGLRLAQSILNALTVDVASRTFWSDSIDVLSWIRSTNRKYRQFVEFRISEILDASKPSEWRWVPTKLNVADDATKWKDKQSLNSDDRWFRGPEFLRSPHEQWPIEKIFSTKACDEEVRANFVHIETELGNLTPDPNRFSSWRRLLRSQAYVLRFFSLCKIDESVESPANMNIPKNAELRTHCELSKDELERAEEELFRQAQLQSFNEEIDILKKSTTSVVPKSSRIFSFSPFLDEKSILRMNGRTAQADWLSLDARYPIILPNNHKITHLLVNFYHNRFHHQNNETVVNELRQRFCIRKLRAVVKRVCQECQQCKNHRAKPVAPLMSDLPSSRTAFLTRPFTFTGIDFFGPQEVVVGRRTEKRYGVLFTCLTLRAIHIEIAHSLSTDSCIMCVRNFVARRGLPKEFISDNGTNLRGANNALQQEIQGLDFAEVRRFFDNITWKFNPPASPHMGGSWERLIRSVKVTLNALNLPRKPTDELYRCYLMEAESIVNSRPLTYIPLEKDTDEALTPNHFILGCSSGVKAAGEFNDDVMILRQNWKKSQFIAEQFWNRWLKEYLPVITRRTKWFQSTKPLCNGDIVMVWDKYHRSSWEKGVIIDTVMGSNRQVRQVVVRTASGVYTRPALKVARLDVYKEDRKQHVQPSISLTGGEDVDVNGNLNPVLSGEQN